MSKSPLALVREKFTDKKGLVEAVKKLATDDLWLDRLNEDKGLEHVSNARLLRLHAILSEVKKEFGSRAALVEAIRKLERRAKDDGLKARLERLPTPRLLDTFRAAKKRSASATAA